MELSSSSSPFASYYHLIFISLALAISSLLILVSHQSKKSKSPRRLPPGPPGWPVVGNLFQVANSGKEFIDYVRDLLPTWGPIFTLKMGSRTMIIISSSQLAHEALILKGPVFANRPPEYPTRAIFSSNKFTVNAALHGPVWRSLRKNMVQNGLSSSRLKEFKGVRDNAMDTLIAKIKAEADANDGVVSVLKNVRFAVFCILLRMCFGVDMDDETIEKVDRMMKLVVVTLDPSIDDFLPILRPFSSKKRKQAMAVRKQQIETLVPLIQKRRAIVQAGLQSNPTAAPFSYLDTLFGVQVQGRESAPSDAELVTLCSEFLNGGIDTTATGVEWAMGRFIENPSMQARLYDEIQTVAGPRAVEEKDLDHMPYLHAFVKELLRKHPPTYFSLAHAATEPATLGGYDIPANCSVEFFLPGISEDPKLWSEPGKFNPDRFLSGQEDADITGASGIRMIPFGAGRRICPGLGMATIHVHLIIARMVQEFEWCAFPEGSQVDFTAKSEFTVVMKNPLRAKIKPRQSSF